jgi:hypothetical protein
MKGYIKMAETIKELSPTELDALNVTTGPDTPPTEFVAYAELIVQAEFERLCASTGFRIDPALPERRDYPLDEWNSLRATAMRELGDRVVRVARGSEV